MNNREKSFTRLDAQGNRVPGSSVQRLSMPRTGKWVEDNVNICCFPYTELSYTVVDPTDDAFTFVLNCDATAIFTILITATAATTTIDELADLLNTKLAFLGTFTVNGADLDAKFKNEVLDLYPCAGTLSFEVEPTV